jgi:hypothetical protein
MVAKRIIVAAGLAVIGAMLMSGCTTAAPTASRAPHSEQALVPLNSALRANQLLKTVIAPPGATEVAAAPNTGLHNGGMVSGCRPRTDVARYWTVANTTPQSVTAYLHAHASKGFGAGATGSLKQGKKLIQLWEYSFSLEPKSQTSLSYVVMRLDSHTVGVAAKVDFIPLDATCTHYAPLATAPQTT